MSERESTRTPPLAGPMGQVLLGLRSLFVRIAIFVTMAALLAWALGGTLWPRTTVRVIGEPVEIASGRIALVHQVRPPRATYGIAKIDEQGAPQQPTPRVDQILPAWREALSPVASPQGDRAAFALSVGGQWLVAVVDDAGAPANWRSHEVIDRLEAARQLARFAAGLPLQDEATQREVRAAVLAAER